MRDDDRIESSLKAIGDAYVRDHPPDFPAFRAAVLGRRRRRTWIRVGAAVALAGAAALAVLFATRGGTDLGRSLPPAHEDHAVTASIPVGAHPSQVNVGHEAIWVSSRSGSLTRIDPVSHEASTIDIGGIPTDLAVGANGIWVANAGRLQHFDDTGTRKLATYDLGSPGAEMHVSISPGAVWAVVVGDSVWRIDTHTGTKERVDVGTNPVDIAVGHGALWVLGQLGVVQRYDLRTRAPEGGAFDVPGGDQGEITLGAGALWYGSRGDRVITSIDPKTEAVNRNTLPSGYVDIGVGRDEVWVLMEDGASAGALAPLDPSTGGFSPGTVHQLAGDPVDVAVGRRALWVINTTDARALRLDKAQLIGGSR